MMQPTYAVFSNTEQLDAGVQHIESAKELAEEHLRENNPDASGELRWDGVRGNRLFYRYMGEWKPSGYHIRVELNRQEVSS